MRSRQAIESFGDPNESLAEARAVAVACCVVAGGRAVIGGCGGGGRTTSRSTRTRRWSRPLTRRPASSPRPRRPSIGSTASTCRRRQSFRAQPSRSPPIFSSPEQPR